jgi:hypothetical protein
MDAFVRPRVNEADNSRTASALALPRRGGRGALLSTIFLFYAVKKKAHLSFRNGTCPADGFVPQADGSIFWLALVLVP